MLSFFIVSFLRRNSFKELRSCLDVFLSFVKALTKCTWTVPYFSLYSILMVSSLADASACLSGSSLYCKAELSTQ